MHTSIPDHFKEITFIVFFLHNFKVSMYDVICYDDWHLSSLFCSRKSLCWGLKPCRLARHYSTLYLKQMRYALKWIWLLPLCLLQEFQTRKCHLDIAKVGVANRCKMDRCIVNIDRFVYIFIATPPGSDNFHGLCYKLISYIKSCYLIPVAHSAYLDWFVPH